MLAYGKNVLIEAINNNILVKKVFLQDGFKDSTILDMINKKEYVINYLTKSEMDKKCSGNHQGVIIEVEDYKYTSEQDMLNNINSKSLIVILDHLEDPHNFGAIIRTCEAANVDYIIIPKDRTVKVNSTVVKVSAGAINNVNIVMVTNLNNIINKLKKKNVWIVGSALENSVSYNSINYDGATALIIGNEGHGMSKLTKDNCDFIVNIPMIGKINSLNASVAAGILIYEVVRQRGLNG